MAGRPPRRRRVVHAHEGRRNRAGDVLELLLPQALARRGVGEYAVHYADDNAVRFMARAKAQARLVIQWVLVSAIARLLQQSALHRYRCGRRMLLSAVFVWQISTAATSLSKGYMAGSG